MVDETLKSYWILVRGHRSGDAACLLALELMATGKGREAVAAARYCAKTAA